MNAYSRAIFAHSQRDLSVSYEKVGSVQLAQDDFAGALKSYHDTLAIRERLAQSDPGSARWQSDLSVSFEKVGEVQLAQDDFAGALKSFRDSLAIRERLAQPIPATPVGSWLLRAATHILPKCAGNQRIGRKPSNDCEKALAALREEKAIMDRLVKLSPDNAGWNRDLAWFDQQIAGLTE